MKCSANHFRTGLREVVTFFDPPFRVRNEVRIRWGGGGGWFRVRVRVVRVYFCVPGEYSTVFADGVYLYGQF